MPPDRRLLQAYSDQVRKSGLDHFYEARAVREKQAQKEKVLRTAKIVADIAAAIGGILAAASACRGEDGAVYQPNVPVFRQGNMDSFEIEDWLRGPSSLNRNKEQIA